MPDLIANPNGFLDWVSGYSYIPKNLLVLFILLAAYRLHCYICACRVELFHSKETCKIPYRRFNSDTIQETSLEELIQKHCPSLSDPSRNVFYSHPLLPNGNMQTIWSSLHGDHIMPQRVSFKREFVDLPDGGVIGLDWTDLPSEIPSATPTPLVFVCHGLTGGSHECYLQEFILELVKYNYRAVVMNFRGCSDTPVRTAKLYSGSSVDDLGFCLDYVKKRDPSAVLFGVGFSLGANVILKYAGRLGHECPLIGIVSLANPYDVLGCVRALSRSFFGRNVYNPKMGSNFKYIFIKNREVFKNADWVDIQEVRNAKCILEFDEAATSKMVGYKTVHEYYRFCSCAFDIPYVKVPTLLLSALDDPIVNKEVIPYHEIKVNPHMILATTKYGGHLGWYQGQWNDFFPQDRWFPKPTCEFLDAIYKAHLSLDKVGQVKKPVESHSGTPWYSIPSIVKSDRELLRKLQAKAKACKCETPDEQLTNDVQTSPTTRTVAKQKPKNWFLLNLLPRKLKLMTVMLIFGYIIKKSMK